MGIEGTISLAMESTFHLSCRDCKKSQAHLHREELSSLRWKVPCPVTAKRASRTSKGRSYHASDGKCLTGSCLPSCWFTPIIHLFNPPSFPPAQLSTSPQPHIFFRRCQGRSAFRFPLCVGFSFFSVLSTGSCAFQKGTVQYLVLLSLSACKVSASALAAARPALSALALAVGGCNYSGLRSAASLQSPQLGNRLSAPSGV